MRVDYTVAEVQGMSLEACLSVLDFNDPNGVYTQEEHIVTWGVPWTLIDARLQVLIELQSGDNGNEIEWHETERVDALRAQLR